MQNTDSAILIVTDDCNVVFCNKVALSLLKQGASLYVDRIISVNGGSLIYIAAGELKAVDSIIFHQLKNPLASIKWVTESLFDLNEEQLSKLKDVQNANQYLINLVNDLLDIARIESGIFKISRQNTDIKALIADAIKLFQSMAEQKQLRIIINEQCKIEKTRIDPSLFNNTFVNLLEDAISYSKENSNITISLSCDERNFNYIIAVISKGIIISAKEDRDKIFTKFYRGMEAKKIRPLGTGLGLYIARLCAEANGGKIWFDSSLERGTTFYFSIPKT